MATKTDGAAEEAAPEYRPGPQLDGGPKWSRQAAVAFLESCPKAPVQIPLELHEQTQPGPFYHLVLWNSHGYAIRKGSMEMVPEPIAQIVYQSLSRERTEQFATQRPWDCLITHSQAVRGEAFGGKQIG